MKDDEYWRTAKELARATRMSDASAGRIEQQLVTAMADVAPTVSTRPAPWHALAAAAAVLIIVGTVVLWNLNRQTEEGAPAKHVVSDRPSVVPAAPPTTMVVTSAVNSPQTGRQASAKDTVPPPPSVSLTGFVELPWTAGLPAFESGEIVRMEIPVASLPAYGFDISRGSDRAVEADVLVGQDGLARAMRLVSNNARSTQ